MSSILQMSKQSPSILCNLSWAGLAKSVQDHDPVIMTCLSRIIVMEPCSFPQGVGICTPDRLSNCQEKSLRLLAEKPSELFSEIVFGIAPLRQHSCLFSPVSLTSWSIFYCSPLHFPSTFPSMKKVTVGFHIIIGEVKWHPDNNLACWESWLDV